MKKLIFNFFIVGILALLSVSCFLSSEDEPEEISYHAYINVYNYNKYISISVTIDGQSYGYVNAMYKRQFIVRWSDNSSKEITISVSGYDDEIFTVEHGKGYSVSYR